MYILYLFVEFWTSMVAIVHIGAFATMRYLCICHQWYISKKKLLIGIASLWITPLLYLIIEIGLHHRENAKEALRQ